MFQKLKFQQYVILLAIFTTIFFGLYFLNHFTYDEKIKSEIDTKVKVFSTQIRTINDFYKNYSLRFYDTLLQDDRVINILKEALTANKQTKDKLRKKLYRLLDKRARFLKKVGVNKIHFHFKNSTTFLRMHKPHRYGDDLSKIRFSVKKVNETKKSVEGLELGVHAHAFRYVFPIFDKENNHLGSVEASVSSNSFLESMTNTFNSHIHFIVDKEHVKSKIKKHSINKYYVQSKESSLYLQDKKSQDKDYMNDSMKSFKHTLHLRAINKQLRNYELKKIKEPFYLTGDRIHLEELVIFIPVQNIKDNKTIAYFVIFMDDNYLKTLYDTHLKIEILLFLFSFLVTYIVYRNMLSKQRDINEHNNRLESIKFSSIGQMAAGITHEINTPLTYMKGLVEMSMYDIQDLEDSDIKKRLLQDNKKISDAIVRMSIIIESMREMSQKSTESLENFNLYSTLITTLRLSYNKSKHISNIYINGKLFNLEKSNKEELEFIVRLQKQRIEQVWIVIINNALDELIKIPNFNDRRLDITIKEVKGKVIVEFQDNAGGIPDDILENIYEPFVGNKTSGGMGVGLNVAKKIIDQNNATIKAQNRDKGACFTVVFNKYSKTVI